MNSSAVILLIEDNPDNRLIYATILRFHGYPVLEAETGMQGAEMAVQHRPDLILLDIGLPDISGLRVLEMLKADPATADIPVFAVTAHSFADELATIVAAGFERVITKPIEPRELVIQIEQWWNRGVAG